MIKANQELIKDLIEKIEDKNNLIINILSEDCKNNNIKTKIHRINRATERRNKKEKTFVKDEAADIGIKQERRLKEASTKDFDEVEYEIIDDNFIEKETN